MGSNLCSTQQVSSLQHNMTQFLHTIKYYDTERDPISCQDTEVYSYKQIFIHKKQYYLQTKQQLQNQHHSYLPVQDVQQESNKYTNYAMCIFAQHFNYSLKKHIQNLRFKGVKLKNKEIIYILRELVIASSYLVKKNLNVRSLDSDDIYLNAAYQVKMPIENISSLHYEEIQMLPVALSTCCKQVQYLSPEQFDHSFKSQQTNNIIRKSSQLPRIFSLGMLIMQCYTMLDASVSYYNYTNKKLDIKKLNQDIQLIKDKTLAAIVPRMLQVDLKKRIRLKQLQEIVKKLDENMFEKYLTIY